MVVKTGSDGDNLAMCGCQKPFNYLGDDSLATLYQSIQDRLISDYSDVYGVDFKDFVYIEIMFITLDEKLLSVLSRDTSLYSADKPKGIEHKVDHSSLIPISVSEESLGIPLLCLFV